MHSLVYNWIQTAGMEKQYVLDTEKILGPSVSSGLIENKIKSF